MNKKVDCSKESSGKFGCLETATEALLFPALDRAAGVTRVGQAELAGNVFDRQTGKPVRPDGLLHFADEPQFKALAGRWFALEVKPHKMQTNPGRELVYLGQQARTYAAARYECVCLGAQTCVDGCLVFPSINRGLRYWRRNRGKNYCRGWYDCLSRVWGLDQVFELRLARNRRDFQILKSGQPLAQWKSQHWKISGCQHRFRQRIGSQSFEREGRD